VLSHASPALFASLLYSFNVVKQQRRLLSQLNDRGLVKSYSDYKKLLYHPNLENARIVRVYLIFFAVSLA
jgi:hypothetical protein